jgi:elongation factor P
MGVTSNQLVPGMVIAIQKELFRVESTIKVTVAKGNPFIKTSLKNLGTGSSVEKSFKLDQILKEAHLENKVLEFLYTEGKKFVFLDMGDLEQKVVEAKVIGECAHFLKEGVPLKAVFYGEKVFSVELPQFLELMVVKVDNTAHKTVVSNATKIGMLETGAKIEVPVYVEEGDIVKIDTGTREFIQRI